MKDRRALWLYLHFPNLQLDSLLSLQKCEHALVVLDPHTNEVIQLNQQATKAGIKLKMGLATAAMLAHDLQVLPHTPQIEENKLTELAEHLYLVTSDISFFAPQGLLLRIHNMLNLYGDLATYWQAIKNQLAPLQVTYQYATGYSPLVARMLALKSWDQITDNYSSLKHQTNQCKLDETDLSVKTIQNLNRVGIHNIKELLAVPLSDIAKRFDIELVNYLGRLTGEYKHPVQFFHPSTQFERYIELLFEIDNAEWLLKPLSHLLNALEQFLKIRDCLVQQLIITLHQRDKGPYTFKVNAHQGEYQADSWAAIITLKLDKITLSAPVYGLYLTTNKATPRAPDRHDLFAGKKGALSHLQLTSLLQAKIGEDAIQIPAIHNDFRPEYANYSVSPLDDTHSQFPQMTQLQKVRPSFLFNAPLPLTEQVSLIHGPERIDTGWWDAHPIVRDYFIARTHLGKWYWIYRTPEKKWYLHGVFS